MLYLSANEIKGLPGLPQSDRGLRSYLSTIASRPRAGRGGGVEYALTDLPPIAQAAIAHREAVAAIPLELLPNYGPEPDIRPDMARADARAWFINTFNAFKSHHQLCTTKALAYFHKAIEFGLIAIPATVSAIVKKFSITTLRRWLELLKSEGLTRLRGAWKGRVGIEQHPIVIETLPHVQRLSASLGLQALKTVMPDNFKLSVRQFSRLNKNWREANPVAYCRSVEGKDAYRNKFGRKEGSQSEFVTRPNQLWELDGTKTNVMIDGKRYWRVVAIDVYSRRVVQHLSPVNDKIAIMHGLMLKAIEILGIPDAVKIDNGSEYVNSHFLTTCSEWKIEVIRCLPGQPQQKPHVERFHGTFARSFEITFPGYIGASVDERRSLDDIIATVTPEQYQSGMEHWNEYYSNRYHSGIKCTPNEKWAQGIAAGAIIRRVSPEDLRRLQYALLEPAGDRIIGAEGISLHGYHYFNLSSQLYEEMRGQRVYICYDPMNASTIYCFNRQGDYLFLAQCPELVGKTRLEVVAERKAIKRAKTKYKQICQIVTETTGETVQPLERSVIAELDVLERAKAIQADAARMTIDISPLPTPPHLEILQDGNHPRPSQEGSLPLDPIERYVWMRERIHQGKLDNPDWDFLRRIESERANWMDAIECDLLYVVPEQLRCRSYEYERKLADRAFILRPNHESMPWRKYLYCRANGIEPLESYPHLDRYTPYLPGVLDRAIPAIAA